jgi:hypothetical protein
MAMRYKNLLSPVTAFWLTGLFFFRIFLFFVFLILLRRICWQ